MNLPDTRTLLTPRALVGVIRALRGRLARVEVLITSADGRRTIGVQVSKAEALRRVRQLYNSGCRIGCYDAFGVLTID